jgi:hypothetical protein
MIERNENAGDTRHVNEYGNRNSRLSKLKSWQKNNGSAESRIKIFFYGHNKEADHLNNDKYLLVEQMNGCYHQVGTFQNLRELKKFLKNSFPSFQLKSLPKNWKDITTQRHLEKDHVYLPLEGDTLRGLAWGMSRKKVTRIEQIEGGEHLLIKQEPLFGFDVTILFGFDDWAHSGLEYIAYSSKDPKFLTVVMEELNETYGSPERVVDYQNLDRLMQEGVITDGSALIRYVKNPESPAFNKFVGGISGLTFRSALKWNKDSTSCLMYTRSAGCPGERNKHNHPYVVEFWPSSLFDFYQEQFAELYFPALTGH